MASDTSRICVYVYNETLMLDANGRVIPKISKANGNGIYIGDDGCLHLKQGATPGGSSSSGTIRNIAGNGVGGVDTEGNIEILRCHKMVTRMEKRANDINVPTLITDIVDGILNWEG
jgi:hypothetical protein